RGTSSRSSSGSPSSSSSRPERTAGTCSSPACPWCPLSSSAELSLLSPLPPLEGEGHRSGEPQLLTDSEPGGLLQHGVAEGDVAGRQPAVPEQDRLVVPLTAGLPSGDDLAQLAVTRGLGQLAGVDVGAERAEAPTPDLAPVVDHDLVHHVGQG